MSFDAWVPVVASLVGGLVAIGSNVLQEWYRDRKTTKVDHDRQKLLQKMLENPQIEWRNLSTLSHTIGADEETTKRLLIAINARASEDGKPIWALISKQPLPNTE